MSLELTEDLLAKTSVQRLVEMANYRHSQFLILTEDDEATGLKANATLEEVQEYHIAPYTARASFVIDRLAQGLPDGEVAPKVRYLNRKVNVRRITAAEIIKNFGMGNTLYLGVSSAPATTAELAPRFEELFGLPVAAEDLINQDIPAGASCILLRFAPGSLAYEGVLRVDLTTKISTVA